MHALSPDDVNEKWLSFHSMWKEIMLGTFQVQNVPSSTWTNCTPNNLDRVANDGVP